MKTHKLKIQEKYAHDILHFKKTFEIRKDDRDFQVNHRIKFTVINKDGKPFYHPLNDKTYQILYILSDFEGLADGYVAMSIKECY